MWAKLASARRFYHSSSIWIRLLVPATLLLVLYVLLTFIHVATYEWQCTTLADLITTNRRNSCSLKMGPTSTIAGTLKIAMVMLYSNDDGNWKNSIMSRVLENRKLYCKIHNYTMINANELIDHSRPPAWSKLIAVKRYLNQFDYVMYIDMDIVIMNFSLKLEQFIAASDGKDIIMANDWNGLNTGVWIAKNSKWSEWFLQTAWDQQQLIQKKSPEGISYPFEYEQRAIHFLTHSKIWEQRKLPRYRGDVEAVRSHIFEVPQCAFNSYVLHPFDTRGKREDSQYVEGDFLVHFAGKKGTMKTDLMTHYLDIVESAYSTLPSLRGASR